MAYPTLAYRCGQIIRRHHYGTTPLAGTARDNQPTRSSPWNTSASECRPRRLHLSIAQRRRITSKDTGKWAKYPIELLPRAYVTKSPDAPRLVGTPRAHLPYLGKAPWARPDITSDLLIVARPILDFPNQLPKSSQNKRNLC